MNAELALLRPGVFFTHVVLLFGLISVQLAGGKAFSNPSTIGSVVSVTTLKFLVNVSLLFWLSPVPLAPTGLATNAVITLLPGVVTEEPRVKVPLAPGARVCVTV